jgi:hypothetical protein
MKERARTAGRPGACLDGLPTRTCRGFLCVAAGWAIPPMRLPQQMRSGPKEPQVCVTVRSASQIITSSGRSGPEPTVRQLRPKLRDSGDANASGDLGKRYTRQVGVLATCGCPARPSGGPLMINLVSRRGHRQVLLATFSRPKTAFPQFTSPFQATRGRNLSLGISKPSGFHATSQAVIHRIRQPGQPVPTDRS